MRRVVLLLAALLLCRPAAAQYDEAAIRALSEQLFGPVPRDAATVLHPLPWGAQPPVRGTTHVLIAQDSHTALVALVTAIEQRGQPTILQPLVLGQAGNPGQCEVPPGMPEGEALEEFSAPREGDSGLGQPIATLTAADGTQLLGLTWRMGERGNAAQALALFRLDDNALVEVACFVMRHDGTATYESGARRRVSNVWRLEPGHDAGTPMLLRDTARPQLRPLAIRRDPDIGRYIIVPPEERDGRRR